MIPLVDEIVVAWKIGDAGRIEELLVDGFDGHDELYERLVTQRNLRWLPKIEELFRRRFRRHGRGRLAPPCG